MGFHVYILACATKGEFKCYYTGQTNNLRARLREHIDNVIEHLTNHFTGRFNFVRLAWSREVPTREDALRLERYLKNLSPNEKRRYMGQNGKIY